MRLRLGFAQCSIELGEGTFSESIRSERLSSFTSLEKEGTGLQLRISRATSSSGEWEPFRGVEPPRGGFRLIGDAIEVHPDVDDRGALLALRILFARAIEAMNGILVHGSCVVVGGRAALAVGASGAGKSTIARWAQRAGATLLSDEVVGLLPDGRVLGTPFFSDRDLVGAGGEARLSLAMTLSHSEAEAFTDRPAHHLVQALCAQAFNRPSGVSARDVLVCVASALTGVRTGVYSCRNAASAGTTLVNLLHVGGD